MLYGFDPEMFLFQQNGNTNKKSPPKKQFSCKKKMTGSPKSEIGGSRGEEKRFGEKVGNNIENRVSADRSGN